MAENKIMKKGIKYSLLSFGGVVGAIAVVIGILYVVKPRLVRRFFRKAASVSDVFFDRLKGKPYSKGDYDGIDVSRNNGVIKWHEVAKDKKIQFVYIKATEGKGHVDPYYRRNIRRARKEGLKVGSYHFFTSKSSAIAQFMHFKSVVKKSEQDLIPVLDVEKHGIRGRWDGEQLQDSVRVFAELVKKYYGKYPIIYTNEHFYNNELGHQFNRYFLYIANYRRSPSVHGDGKHNIWQYSERGHLHGIGEYVDLNRFAEGTAIADLLL